MIELDPRIMKRSLPPNIHATIDQVTANVNAAVDEIIDRFVQNATTTVERIQKGDFTGEIAMALEQSKKALTDDIDLMDGKLVTLAAANKHTQSLAQNAGANATQLAQHLTAVNNTVNALQQDLTAFRTKVDTFATKSGSFIASTALKAVGVPPIG